LFFLALTLKVIKKGKDDQWLFLSALLFGKVDACLLLVEDKCVAVVAGPAGREGLQVLAQQVAGREIRAAYVPHHPVQIFFSLLNMIKVFAKAGLRNPDGGLYVGEWSQISLAVQKNLKIKSE
jgi:hypothetical protein